MARPVHPISAFQNRTLLGLFLISVSATFNPQLEAREVSGLEWVHPVYEDQGQATAEAGFARRGLP